MELLGEASSFLTRVQCPRKSRYKICAWSDWLAACLSSTNCRRSNQKKLIFPTSSAEVSKPHSQLPSLFLTRSPKAQWLWKDLEQIPFAKMAESHGPILPTESYSAANFTQLLLFRLNHHRWHTTETQPATTKTTQTRQQRLNAGAHKKLGLAIALLGRPIGRFIVFSLKLPPPARRGTTCKCDLKCYKQKLIHWKQIWIWKWKAYQEHVYLCF